MNKLPEENQKQLISRKEALKKAGKYTVFTAAAAIVLLVPKTAQAYSSPVMGEGYRNGGYSPPVSGSRSSPFSKPEPSGSKSGLRDSPWR